jgi:hypothetical protein
MAERSPKKKRKADSSLSPKKNRSVKIQVESSAPTENPIVVSFPGGLPEGLHSNAPSSVALPEFQWEKLKKKSSAGRKVVGKDKHCTYTSSAAGLGFDDRRTKLCVGVYDKKTGIVVIREAASRGTVFSLQQSIPSYVEKNGPIQFSAGQNLLSYSNQVFEDFGSAKKRKVLKSQAANRVEIDNVVGAGEGSAVMNQVIQGEAMSESNRKAVADSKADGESTVSGYGSNRAIDAAHEAARRKFLPTYDENAIKPNKVYNPRDIAGDDAWTKVYNKVHACMHDNDPTESIIGSLLESDWHPSVLKLVKAINAESDDCKDRYTCAILANHVIRFYSMSHKRKSIPAVNLTKAKYFGLPVEVAAQWIKLFTTSVSGTDGNIGHVMSKQDKDKSVVHALLLFMMAHGVAMKIPSLKSIAEDLKVPVNDCAQMLRLAGCQVTKKGTSMSAVLKTPLTFPPPRRAVNRN